MYDCNDPSGPEGYTREKGAYSLLVYGYGPPGRYKFTLAPVDAGA
jgi:hypothetical protein